MLTVHDLPIEVVVVDDGDLARLWVQPQPLQDGRPVVLPAAGQQLRVADGRVVAGVSVRGLDLEDDVAGPLVFVDGDLVAVTVEDGRVVVHVQEVHRHQGARGQLVQAHLAS